MSFKPEDGTGLPDSNSYVSVVDADAYFALRGITTWAAQTLESKQSALVNATQYIDVVFGSRFLGVKLTAGQALEWPRAPGCNDSGIDPFPKQLLPATCEYANIALAGSLFPSIEYDETGRLPSLKREKFAVFEEETRWTSPSGPIQPTLIRPYPSADIWILKLCKPRSSSAKILR